MNVRKSRNAIKWALMTLCAILPLSAHAQNSERTNDSGIQNIPPSVPLYDRGPRLIYQPKAIYPRKALEINAKGVVVVLCVVNEQGNVTAVRIVKSSGNVDLDNAAYVTAKNSLFTPPMKDGRPVAFQGLQEFKFDPSQGPALPGLPTPKPIE